MMRQLTGALRSFTKKEAIVFVIALAVFIFSSLSWGIEVFVRGTERVAVPGGTYREGLTDQPTYVNPVLGAANDADRDLIALLFARAADLAERITPDKNGTLWTVRLKENIAWDDGEPITSDDFLFTLRAIQNFEVQSPHAPLFEGVEADRASEREFSLTLVNPYAFFEETIRDFRPLPKHIFGALPLANLSLSEYNLEPVGSGPYRLSKIEKRRDGFITEYHLRRNDGFAGAKPYLDAVVIKFYPDEKAVIQALNANAIDGVAGIDPVALSNFSIPHTVAEIRLPRYYAVFFNPYAEPIFLDKNVRRAMEEAVPRADLIREVLQGRGIAVRGPLLPGMDGYMTLSYDAPRDIQSANQILDRAGWTPGEDGVRAKTVETGTGKNKAATTARLEFTLVAPDLPFLRKTADLLRDAWEGIGVRVTVDARPLAEIEEGALKTRSYDMLLFGHILPNADLFSFWHASEKFYPGLNLALYDNKTADVLLEALRKNMNEARRVDDLQTLRSLIEGDVPAVFLYSPSYLYIQKPAIRGFVERTLASPADRFRSIANWYVKTARVFK